MFLRSLARWRGEGGEREGRGEQEGVSVVLDQLCKLRSELDHAALMIENYEQSQEEKNQQLRHLQVCSTFLTCSQLCSSSQ